MEPRLWIAALIFRDRVVCPRLHHPIPRTLLRICGRHPLRMSEGTLPHATFCPFAAYLKCTVQVLTGSLNNRTLLTCLSHTGNPCEFWTAYPQHTRPTPQTWPLHATATRVITRTPPRRRRVRRQLRWQVSRKALLVPPDLTSSTSQLRVSATLPILYRNFQA
jgi:hypothetical protein